MKKLTLISFGLVLTVCAKAQSQGTGIGTISPDASSQLDVTSTTKGFLPPRMDSTQRNAISNPAAGLVIFNTSTKQLEVNTGSAASPVWSSTKAGTTASTTLTSATSPAGTSVGQMMYNTGSTQPTGLIYWDGTQWKSVASSGGNTTNNYTVVNNKTVTNNDSVINNNPVINNDTSINNGPVYNTNTVTNGGSVTNNGAVTNNSTSTFNGAATFNKKAVFNDTAVFSGGMKVSNLPQGQYTDSVLVFEPTTKVMRRISVAGATAATQPWYKTGTTTAATANTDSVYISGNVGIGTPTPLSSAKLHVNGGSVYFTNLASNAGLTITGNTNQTFVQYTGNTPGNSNTSLNLSGRGGGNADLTINGGTGNVGIGTTTPDASAQLDVASTAKGFLPPRMTTVQRNAISNPATGLVVYDSTLKSMVVNAGTPASPVWSVLNGKNLYNADDSLISDRIISTKGRSIAIITATPVTTANARLKMGRTIDEMDMGVAGTAGAGMSSTTPGDAWLKGYNGLAVGTSAGPLRLETGYTERIRIDASGKVGIGTTAPDTSAILDLSSTNKGLLLPRLSTAQRNAIINPAAGLVIYDNTLKSMVVNAGTPASPVWSVLNGKNLYNADDSLTGNRFITTNGHDLNLITASSTAHARITMGRQVDEMDMGVAGTAGAGMSSTKPGDAWVKGYKGLALGTTTGPLRLETGYTERMRVDSIGNVGIGTSTPVQKLDIVGNMALRNSAVNGGTKNISLQSTSGYDRWAIGMGVGETGSSNGGGNFYIWNYADNGSFLGNPFIINRAHGNIGINNGAPDTSAVLDVASTTKGVLLPRMTQAQRSAIGAPATGLLVYQTDAPAGYWYYTGTAWTRLSSSGNLTTLIADAANVTGGSTNGTGGTKTVWSSSFTSYGGTLDFAGYGSLYVNTASVYISFLLSIDGVTVGNVRFLVNTANTHITYPLNFKVGGIAAGTHTIALAITGNTSPANCTIVDNNDFFSLKVEER